MFDLKIYVRIILVIFKVFKNFNLKFFVWKNKKLFFFYDVGNVFGVVV